LLAAAQERCSAANAANTLGAEPVHFLSHPPGSHQAGLHALEGTVSWAQHLRLSRVLVVLKMRIATLPEMAAGLAHQGDTTKGEGRIRWTDPGACGFASRRPRVARIGTRSGTAARGVIASLWQWRRVCSARRMRALRQPKDGGSGGPPGNSIAADCRGCARRQSGLHSTGGPH
jgi:hypothetical protein